MERTVHIAPQGWEHDRVVKPAIAARAHRVYLLARRDHERTEHFLNLAQETLQGDDVHVEVVEIDPEREFESTLLNVARILRKESEDGNRVFVNMSSGGKVAAVGSSLAAMYHSERAGGIYYASPDHYLVGIGDDNGETDLAFEEHGLTAGYAGQRALPTFQLNKPSRAGVRTLVEIYSEGPMDFDQILAALHRHGLDPYDDPKVGELLDTEIKSDVRRTRQKWVQRLRRSVVDELQDLHLISQTQRGVGGKVHLGLTRDGEYYALASGLVDELRAPQ